MEDKKGMIILGGAGLLLAALVLGKKAGGTPGTFVCPFGDGTFTTLAAWEAHMAAVHPEVVIEPPPDDPDLPPVQTEWVCPFSDATVFTSAAALYAHLLAIHPETVDIPVPPEIPPEEVPIMIIDGHEVITKYEYNAWLAQRPHDTSVERFCPVCFDHFFYSIPGSGSTWMYYDYHVKSHTDTSYASSWGEACPFDSIWFDRNPGPLVAHLKDEHHYTVNLPSGSGGGYDPGYDPEPIPEVVSGAVKIKVWNKWDNQVGPFNVPITNMLNKDAEIRVYIAQHLAGYIANTPAGETWEYWEV